jgi:pimeloyl-ACP methyl ester carboxylesterase
MNNTKLLPRRRMLKQSGATLAALAFAATTGFGEPAVGHANQENSMDIKSPTPKGPGSVSGAPGLSSGFRNTFTSRYIQAGGLRQHAVIGGDGPPLLLVHGWPQNWYAWRLLMPALAKDFTVIAVDQRGIGLTNKPQDGYDSATIANDLVALMDALGHRRFAVVGQDTGYLIGYALAADHRERVARLVLTELPGVLLPPLPPPAPAPTPLFAPDSINNRLWHIPFNRVNDSLTEQLVKGHEDIFFGYEFNIQAGEGKKLAPDVIDYYVRLYSNRDALRGSFGFFRAWFTTLRQNVARMANPLPMPVLAIGGATSWKEDVGNVNATDKQTVVVPNGHWVAETAPEETLSALTAFLAPYRDTAGTASSLV